MRARSGVTSRPAISFASGSSSWRTRLRHIEGEAFDESRTGSIAELGAHRLGLATPQGEDRVERSGFDARQPVAAAAAQQSEQHGLGLVVGGVPGERARRQRRTAGATGTRLEVGARREVDRVAHERDAELRCDLRSRVGFGSRFRPQSVVDMVSHHVESVPYGERDEGGRVRSARERGGNLRSGTWRSGTWERAAGEQRVERGFRAPSLWRGAHSDSAGASRS